MIDRLQAVLDEMDAWLAEAGSGEARPVPRDALIQWQIALTTVHDHFEKLQHTSQSAVDAFLLRPSQSARSATTTTGSGRPSGQKLYQRLAEAMAELEKVLVETKVQSGESDDA
jgi:hypothetical protein